MLQLSGFGCAAILTHDVADRSAEAAALGCAEATLEEVLRCDVVVSAVPLLDSTLHGIGRAALATMSPSTLLVNISRGSVVDEAAVAAALHSGALGGYAADVFEFEDWGKKTFAPSSDSRAGRVVLTLNALPAALPDRPRAIPPELLDAPRTLFTPHLGNPQRSN